VLTTQRAGRTEEQNTTLNVLSLDYIYIIFAPVKMIVLEKCREVGSLPVALNPSWTVSWEKAALPKRIQTFLNPKKWKEMKEVVK